MEKNKFKAPVMEIILFDAADIITNSTDENDVPLTDDDPGNDTETDTD